MDTTVEKIGESVVVELRSAGYMESTIDQYEKTIRTLMAFVDRHGGVYTRALGAVFAAMTTSPRTGRFSAQRRSGYGRLVRVFDTYVATGRVDLATSKRGGGGAWPDSATLNDPNVKPRNQPSNPSTTGQSTVPRHNVSLGIIGVKPESA